MADRFKILERNESMSENNDKILIYGGKIYLNGQFIENGYVKMRGGTIIGSGRWDRAIDSLGYRMIELPAHYKIVPGFIDVHIHGADGADVMDATSEALAKMAAVLPEEGTTSFLATTITSEVKSTENALINVNDYIGNHQQQGDAEILGIHLEGPFINKKRAGAQPIAAILKPDVALFRRWQSIAGGHIKKVTLAPELEGANELLSYLKNEQIVSSIGHSDAGYDEVLEAVESGVSSVTHLFNQMSGLHHREPGIVGAAFLNEELSSEMIVDGLHIRPEAVKIAFLQKRAEGLVLITDSMRAKHAGEGEFDLGGQKVVVKDGLPKLENGSLAGSILKMNDAVANVMKFTGCRLEDAIMMAAVNPAQQLGLDNKGSLDKDKDADLVVLDKNCAVVMSFCKGILAYERKENLT